MRMRRRYLAWMVTVVLMMSLSLALSAQEQPKPEAAQAQKADAQKPGEKPAPVAVPPDVLQKAKAYKGSPTPPRKLQKVDDHWSPYEAPTTPPEGAEVYTIVKGDCLSLIAQRQLGNKYLWPQIWDLNPYIKDAHWIYPGDPLFIKKPKVVNEEIPLAETVPPAPQKTGMELDKEAPMPPVNARDVYCSGFISKNWKRPHLTILSAPERWRESLGTGEVVYLNEGTAEGMQTGMSFGVLEEGQKITHPITTKDLGQFIRRKGQVKILAVQQHTSIAEIVESCDAITYGDVLIPWKVIPIPWDIKRSPTVPLQAELTDKPIGRVVWTEDRLGTVGQHNIVYVDLGQKNQVLPGDKVWIYRYPAKEGVAFASVRDLFRQSQIDVRWNDLFRPQKVGTLQENQPQGEEVASAEPAAEVERPAEVQKAVDDTPKEQGPENPATAVNEIRQYVGEGVVLTTEDSTACVKVLNSVEGMNIGNWVQIE
jgi:hypothetical protein